MTRSHAITRGSPDSAADKPARLAPASALRLQDPLESMCLKEADCAHIRGGLVDTVAVRLHWVPLNHDRPADARMLNCAIEQLMHQTPAPESGPDHKAHRRPRVAVINMRNGARVDQGAIGSLRRDRAPADDLAVNER